jgi:ribosomal protein S18 acetylase RimI-like enzyme
MNDDLLHAYVAGFVARCDAQRAPSQPLVDEPGLYGLLSSGAAAFTRILVTDDRAYDVLVHVLPPAGPGLINILARAERCAALLRSAREWKASLVTPMVCRDLAVVPKPQLPDELTLRPVRRLPHDPPGGVPLEDAARLAARVDPDYHEAGAEASLARYLRSLAPAFRLFAAVDEHGTVRATSGFGVFGRHAGVLFVNTDVSLQRRGIGRAMTAAALHDARRQGAIHASLDSSEVAVSLYRHLGFEVLGGSTHFFKAG